MKRTLIYVSFSSLFLFSCGMGKNATNRTPKPAGETLLESYCNSDEYLSNNDYFRSTGIGESMDQMTANKKARSNAQSELAKTIKSTMQIVGDNYVKSSEVNNKEELTETFQEMSRTIVDQELVGAIKICEKYTKTAEGNYKCYMAIELSGSDILSKYNEKLSKDDQIKADYNYETFKETFNEEMKKLEEKEKQKK